MEQEDKAFKSTRTQGIHILNKIDNWNIVENYTIVSVWTFQGWIPLPANINVLRFCYDFKLLLDDI